MTISTTGVVGHAVTVFSLKQTLCCKTLLDSAVVTWYGCHVATLGTNAIDLTVLLHVLVDSSLIWAWLPID